ncbi:MAG: N-6 DNA methylase, partial [Phototrophicaceae bacterium]
MPELNLKPADKAIRDYHANTGEMVQLRFNSEGNVSPAFADLLLACARKVDYTLVEQFPDKRNGKSHRYDGAVLTPFKLIHGIWEAKDSKDTLEKEIAAKFGRGYPKDNILFQQPDRAILYQDGALVMDVDPREAQSLVNILREFFRYVPPMVDQWERAVANFKPQIPQVAQALRERIADARAKRKEFRDAFTSFHELVKSSVNPTIDAQTVETMLIQHILTERIFRKVFDNPEFTRRNAIAAEIEKVIDVLIRGHYTRDDFTASLNHFYGALEQTAATIDDYSQKQDFLNTVYEQFFQGFDVKAADTFGIVYTPQSIVDFMVRSVDALLEREFGRTLADKGVHVLDPFVGTGNFMVRVIRQIAERNPAALPHKYAEELHCNEIMLLPYYIASQNIEHAYREAVQAYAPFEGICLVDTFDLNEHYQMPMFAPRNSERIERQRTADLFVVMGNPPYNTQQENENDNNKNRVYTAAGGVDDRIRKTYAKDSKATNKNALSDPYVKAFRWASDRLKDEGIVAFVTNGGFIDGIAFDGMRQHLQQDFDALYILDLGGNSRKT